MLASTTISGTVPGQVTDPKSPYYRNPFELYLESPDLGLTLNASIDITDSMPQIRPDFFRLYYLSPLDVSEGQVSLGVRAVQAKKQYVTDIPAAPPFSVEGIVVTPTGTTGSRRDYGQGGWMYAIGTKTGGIELLSQATTPIPVPTFPADTTPPNKTFSNVTASYTGPTNVGTYTVTVGWTNPFPSYGTVRYAEIWLYNYLNKGLYECLGDFKCSTSEGGAQTVSFYLESESSVAVHNDTFYVAELNASHMRIFGKAITSHGSATITGGIV